MSTPIQSTPQSGSDGGKESRELAPVAAGVQTGAKRRPGLIVPPGAAAGVMPGQREAEAALLGALMGGGLNGKPSAATLQALGMVDAGDFENPLHGQLFTVLERLLSTGQPVDLVLLPNELAKAGLPTDQNAKEHLIELVESVPTPDHAPYYAQQVREAGTRRRISARLRTWERRLAEPNTDLATVAAELAVELAALSEREGTNAAGLEMVRMSDVQSETVQWLWPGRIPLSKLTMMAGDPGLGKSFISLDLTARITSGLPWPDAPTARAIIGSVVLLSAEDDPADTIRPRLDAAGADPSSVHVIKMVRRPGGKKAPFDLSCDLPALELAIKQLGDVRMIVIDPVTAYLGAIDSHKNADVRALLTPLSDLASRYKTAILAVTHLNKAAGGSAIQRASGSIAFMAAARCGWMVTKDRANPERRLFLPIKNNIAPDIFGMAYSIQQSDTPGIARLVWENDPIRMTADDAMRDHDSDGDGGSDAVEWLKTILADGEMAAETVLRQAAENNFSQKAIRRAGQKLGMKRRKSAFGGPWTWHIPNKPDTPANDAQDAPS